MKIVLGGIARTALVSTSLALVMMGLADAAQAQSGTAGSGAANSAQSGAGNNGGATAGTGAGTGTGLTPGGSALGGMTGGSTGGVPGGVPSAPALNSMRANGTSLYMSPDPRAPNVTGRAAPSR